MRGGRCIQCGSWLVLGILCVAVYVSVDHLDAPMTVEEVKMPSSFVASEELLSRLNHRRHHIQQVCGELGLDRPRKGYRVRNEEFLVSDSGGLVWCNVFKAASSTWLWNFNLLAGYTQKELLRDTNRPLLMARAKYPRLSMGKLEAVLSSSPPHLTFMIARHPLYRLVSAYRDKILTQKKSYRPKGRYMKVQYPDLADPPQDLVSVMGSFVGLQIGPPSFRQFVQYVLDKEAKGLPMDEHWTPASQFCTPCLVHYDVVAKVETLEEDSAYIIFTAGIQDRISPRTVNRSPGGATTDQLADHYLCQLSREQMAALVKIYHNDLVLFEYDAQRFVDCTARKTN